ncbi:aminoglycoside phosphotransferase family protein [Haloechinothrix salitolerans]|uniref:Phosphotransferase n=1 Tax=Haloechinothrix salitolerans TaxID=926830 RepID=A0ABW2BV63_9PSEU
MSVVDRVKAAGLAGRVAWHVARERVSTRAVAPDPAQVPPSAEAVTPEWLTEVLCSDVSGAKVLDVAVTGGDDGTSSRRALSVTYNETGHAAGLPESLFAKSTATLSSRLLLGLTEIVDGETRFYNSARPTLRLRSPRAFYAGYDPRSYRSLVLLEDLRVQGWSFPNPLTNRVSRSDAEDMVSELAAYHGAFWESERFAADLRQLKGTYEWQRNLNRKIGFDRRTMVGLRRAASVVSEELLARGREIYPKFMRSLAMHERSPRTLLHQDVHLGNWLRDPDGRMGLYDWQCVATGHWAMDYSYALACGLATEDRRRWEKDLLEYYLDRLRAAGVREPPSFDEAWLAYRQQPLHALVFGLFTLGGSKVEPELQPRDYTLFAIERIARHVTDLDTLDAIE